jgi:hypothetical protein
MTRLCRTATDLFLPAFILFSGQAVDVTVPLPNYRPLHTGKTYQAITQKAIKV